MAQQDRRMIDAGQDVPSAAEIAARETRRNARMIQIVIVVGFVAAIVVGILGSY